MTKKDYIGESWKTKMIVKKGELGVEYDILTDIIHMIHDFLPKRLNYEEVKLIFNKEMCEGLIEKIYEEFVLENCSEFWFHLSLRAILQETYRRWDKNEQKMIIVDYHGEKEKNYDEFSEFVENLRIIKSSRERLRQKKEENRKNG